MLAATRSEIELYVRTTEEQGLAATTIDRRLSTVCGMYHCVFSAAPSRRRRGATRIPALMTGNQIFLAAVTVSEPLRRPGRGLGRRRRQRLEESIHAATVVPVSDKLITVAADLRFACRNAGHPLHDRGHANDLLVAASAIQIGAPLLTADSIFEDAPGLALHQ